MKAIIYTRVSTAEQAQGLSTALQESKCRQQAEVLDMEVVKIVTDGGKSAKNMDRPGIQEIMEWVRAWKTGAVLVYKLDRLTRSIRDLNDFIDLCQEFGVQLVSITESLNTGTASGRMMLNILGTVAQWEREVIVERVTEALDYRKKNGMVYSSSPPYGKKAVEGRLVDDEKEQTIIKLIIRCRKDDGDSWQQIADNLERHPYYISRSGKPWCWQSVQKIWRDNAEGRDNQ